MLQEDTAHACYPNAMTFKVTIIGAGLAGSECALTLARRGISVRLIEMRPRKQTPVHKGDGFAELVCSNSLKSLKPTTAAGMLKNELALLESPLYGIALENRVAAGNALAVDREGFASDVTDAIYGNPNIEVVIDEATDIEAFLETDDAVVIATGPLTFDMLAENLQSLIGASYLAFYDAVAPIVMADSLDESIVFSQSRYEDGVGDYLNAPFSESEYKAFIKELIAAKRVIAKDFESKDLFQACQPIEEIARKGEDAPRFGPMKPVGLLDPRTGKRPWAVMQLRAENSLATSYNLVGFQTNLTFSEQKRVFRMIPGFENAEFARYGVMHRNTFLDAPNTINPDGSLRTCHAGNRPPIYVAGQLSGTEGYVEAIRSGAHVAISVEARLRNIELPTPPQTTSFGALIDYATSPDTVGYQPMHVNFGIMPPLQERVRNKEKRYAEYSSRGNRDFIQYLDRLKGLGLHE